MKATASLLLKIKTNLSVDPTAQASPRASSRARAGSCLGSAGGDGGWCGGVQQLEVPHDVDASVMEAECPFWVQRGSSFWVESCVGWAPTGQAGQSIGEDEPPSSLLQM